ncbi:alpha/beta fold hydrolase [Gordonia amarae]|uniref:Alpha/beta fold hydrolase n=2 Tax=Gordonia amarae TaxID=36821 RepID=A0A857MFA6_9ACTN|nr:alpha/beta fold hydrolase [Gordonia amarae]MCS3880790.1 pimeloyl-ACP methyl ester carboxylesterase [Gordonia amarae]QHN32447.1 alpha/beta fold hydrolase [Gordonia amarae]QHN41196.1 alpha/beta fold hydrolase [Gordonia amarae]GAB06647.1 putative epoxide hydrolase [Gordonia amarae NBRC 15530]
MADRITEYRNGDYVFDVIDAGPIDGTPIVLLHGFPQRATAWDLVAPLLHAQGFRTLAPDQRGYSPRARPGRRRDYTLSALAGDVVALFDAIGAGPVHLVGHDWGAMVAWSVAAKHPDRVKSLTTLSVPHPSAYRAAMPHGQIFRSWYAALINIPRLPEVFLSKAFASPDARARIGLPAESADRLYDDIIASGSLPGALNWYRALPFWSKEDIAPGTVRVPTTHVWSDGDFYLSRYGARHSGRWVDAPYEFRIIAGANHWLPEIHPAEIADAILDRVRG